MSSLFTSAVARFPVTPDQDQQNRHVPPASPTSKHSSRFESVRVFPSRPGPTAVTLSTFLPSRVRPTNLGAFDPPSLEDWEPPFAVGVEPLGLGRRLRGPAAPAIG
jgi:hypothetical protein